VALRDGRRHDAARLFAEAAIKAKESNRLQRAGELFERGGHFEKAGAVFQQLNRAEDALRCYEKSGNSAKILEVLGTIEYEPFLRRVSAGTELFRRCAELLAKEEKFMEAAALLEATGDSVRAAELFTKAGDHYKAAQCYFAAGQKEAAEESVSKVPDRGSAADFRARLAADRGDWIRAGEFYEEAGKFPQAVDAYKKAKAYGRAARLFELQGRHILAAEMYCMGKDFIAAGEAYANGRDARNAAECFETAEDFGRAVEYYIQAGMFLQAGCVAFRTGDFTKAIDSLQRVPVNSPEYRLAQGWLAASFFNMNRPDMAGEIFSRVISDISPARDTLPVFYWYARYLENSDPNMALSTYKVIQGLDSSFEDVERRILRVESQTDWHTPVPVDKPAYEPKPAAESAPMVVLESSSPPQFPEPPPGLQSSGRLQAISGTSFYSAETLPDHITRGREVNVTRAGNFPVIGDPARYHILELVGSDALVTTFRAEDRDLGKIVLLRVFDVSNKKSGHPDRMVEVGRSISRLSHPNVQSVFDAGRNGLRIYLSQERVEGEAYPDIIRRNGPLAPKELGLVLLQVADALGYAHSQGVCHLGLRPNSLICRSNGTVKVTNFGLDWLAVVAADKFGATTNDPANLTVLEPSYMAPEQVTGQSVDSRTDIYALGLVLFFLATGRSPFEIRRITDPIEIARMQVTSGFPMPSTIRATLPEQVDELFVRCTMKNPNERFANADELLKAIKQSLT
jgi:tetratricopeptide (TPR) repeat protein